MHNDSAKVKYKSCRLDDTIINNLGLKHDTHKNRFKTKKKLCCTKESIL